MAVITNTEYNIGDSAFRQGVQWLALANGDTGRPVSLRKYFDLQTMAIGTFGGGTAILQGTLDPRGNPNDADHASAVWFTLKSAQGNDITGTSNWQEQILLPALWIRPSISGGAAGSVNFYLLSRGYK